jgi:site-specific DNA-methyltransferase (adenine-specific)
LPQEAGVKAYYEEAGITIYHGDCREVLPTLQVSSVVTDPPYGMNYVHGAALGPNASTLNNWPVTGDSEPFDPSHLLSYPNLILWGANHYADKLPASRGWLIWDKRCNTVVNDQSDCELAWTNLTGTARIYYHVWDGFRRGPEKNIPRVYPTQKPVDLMKWCLRLTDGPICDPYMGSGSTLVAAKQMGIPAIGIDIEEKAVEIAAKRLAQGVLTFTD